MGTQKGGYRPGAGRPKGSKNKMTIAREAVAEVLDLEDAQMLESAVHRRGHALLTEMERIATDPTQPAGMRIMAARTALPFLLHRPRAPNVDSGFGEQLIALLQQRRGQLARMHRLETE